MGVEGQPGKFVFTATTTDSPDTWANCTNISEIILELETRKKQDAGAYDEESRWIIRVATGTLYKDIVSIATVSPSLIAPATGISGHFNGCATTLNVKAASDFNDDGGRFTLLLDQFAPTAEKIACVSHNTHWICAASDYYAQTWNTIAQGTKLDATVNCWGQSYIKDLSCFLETRGDPDDKTKEQCRYILRLIIESEGTGLTRLEDIINSPTGFDMLGYNFPGSSELMQLSADDTFWGGTGKYDDESPNTTGAWTLIRQSIAAMGNPGGQAFTQQSHLICPSLWFPPQWIGS